MTPEEITARCDQLTADYEAACAAELAARGSADHPDALDARNATSAALVEFRRYWRQVGEATGAFIDRAHNGARVEMVKVRNNDGSN